MQSCFFEAVAETFVLRWEISLRHPRGKQVRLGGKLQALAGHGPGRDSWRVGGRDYFLDSLFFDIDSLGLYVGVHLKVSVQN